jgi:hypothetical protein
MSFAGVDANAGERPVLRAWWPLNCLFLALTLLSTVSLYILAAETDRHFAWTIKPPLSAAFLGGGYAAGFVLVVLTTRERMWARARIAYATVCVFVWVTLLVTLLHLDRFHFDVDDAWPRFLAWLWVVVYVVVPPWMTTLLTAQRRAPGRDPDVTEPMPDGLAAVMIGQAVVLTVVGAGLVTAPTRLSDVWPWTLTPLAGRAIGAWCVALGFAAALSVHERDLLRLRIAAVTYVVFGLLQAGSMVRFRDDVEWGDVSTWFYVGMLLVITSSGAYGWARSASRRRAPRGALDP